MSKMKTVLILAMAAAFVAAFTGCGTSKGAVKATAVNYKDGAYEGLSDKGMDGEIAVRVTVAGGKITEVSVTKQHETVGIGSVALEELPAAVVEKQGTEGVEAITGASVSSAAFLEAVNAALAGAK